MDSPLTAYMTLVVASGVLNLLMGCYVVAKRHLYEKIFTYFILATAATTIYCFSYAFSLTSSTLEQLRFWSVMQYFGMPFAPPFGLMFVLKYLGYRVTRARVAALLVIPTLSLLSNATNELHHLHYKKYQVHETFGAPYNDIEVGVTYIIHGSFTFVCLLSGLLLLCSRWKDTAKTYRPQLVSLIGAHLIPMVTSFLYLVGVTPAGLDPVQQAFLEAGAVQCGFCTPGLVVQAHDLIRRTRGVPSEEEIREALAGNLCRCTGYQKIIDAVRLAAARTPR